MNAITDHLQNPTNLTTVDKVSHFYHIINQIQHLKNHISSKASVLKIIKPRSSRPLIVHNERINAKIANAQQYNKTQ